MKLLRGCEGRNPSWPLREGAQGYLSGGFFFFGPLRHISALGFRDRGVPGQTNNIHIQSTDHLVFLHIFLIPRLAIYSCSREFVNLPPLGLDQDHWRSWARQG